MTRVSIITPTYNRADVIERALDSVQSQTFTNAEHIVVDDGSTDGTSELLEEYSDENVPVQVERLGDNSGANVARNHGLELAEGDFITFLDSDDVYLSERLEKLVEVLEGTEYVGTTHKSTIIDQSGVEIPSRSPVGDIDLDSLRAGNPIGTLSSTMFTQDVINAVGGFDTNFPASQDYELYLRVLDRGQMIGIDDTLLRYHRRDDAISASPDRKATAQELLWEKHAEKLSSDLRARQAYTLGHQYAAAGQMGKARRCFGQSLRNEISLLAIYHLLLAIFGKKTFDLGVTLKRRIYYLLKQRGFL